MLPDFPSLKDELHRIFESAAQLEPSSASSFMEAVARRPMHEGDRFLLVRSTGEEEESAYEEHSAQEVRELPKDGQMTLAEAYAMYQNLMTEMNDAEMAAFIEVTDKVAESIGNVVEGKGRPLPEAILEAVEMMEILFAPRMSIS